LSHKEGKEKLRDYFTKIRENTSVANHPLIVSASVS
jgi:hypothetical protein